VADLHQHAPFTQATGEVTDEVAEEVERLLVLNGKMSQHGLQLARRLRQTANLFDGTSDGISAFQKVQTVHPYGFTQTVQLTPEIEPGTGRNRNRQAHRHDQRSGSDFPSGTLLLK
jgi:hypothetical protein